MKRIPNFYPDKIRIGPWPKLIDLCWQPKCINWREDDGFSLAVSSFWLPASCSEPNENELIFQWSEPELQLDRCLCRKCSLHIFDGSTFAIAYLTKLLTGIWAVCWQQAQVWSKGPSPRPLPWPATSHLVVLLQHKRQISCQQWISPSGSVLGGSSAFASAGSQRGSRLRQSHRPLPQDLPPRCFAV